MKLSLDALKERAEATASTNYYLQLQGVMKMHVMMGVQLLHHQLHHQQLHHL